MKRWTRLLVLIAVFALVAAACGNDEADTTTTTAAPATTTTAAPATTTTAAPTTTTSAPTTTADMGDDIATDFGVTSDPCPGSANTDRGCIYLGVLTDESGPFAAAAPALVGAQRAFWAVVNATGGIGGAYDVSLPDTLKKDTQYNPEVHVQQYNAIANDVVALAQSLGTPQSLAALDDYERDSMAAAPMSWWSGWTWDSADKGHIIEFGTSYCFEAMNAVDWIVANPADALLAAPPASLGILKFPGDYGDDYAAGAIAAAAANNIEVKFDTTIVPISAGGDPTQVEAITTILSNPVDLVMLVSGPTETAAIVAGSLQQGYTGRFIGAAPTWNVGLLASPAAPAFEAGVYFQSSFVGPWDYESVGHATMRQTIESLGLPANDFFISGWASQYGVKAALDAAYAAGDLTRAGVLNAARNLTAVDYQGMMSPRDFSADPSTGAPRESLVGAIDTSQSTGVRVIQDFFVGPTAQVFDFSGPCS